MGTELDREFVERCKPGSDICEHLPLLSNLARLCGRVTEFGVRHGESTIALLHGLAEGGGGALVSYDIAPHCIERMPRLPAGVSWQFELADTGKLADIAPTDFLFIDTWHTAEHVAAELRHASRVREFIALHDTTTFAGAGQGDGEPVKGMGICPAIFDFLASNEGVNWRVSHHAINNNGMVVLSRICDAR